MKLKVDVKCILVLVLFLITKQMPIYLTVMVSMLLHELGHILIGVLLKMKLQKIHILMLGFSINFKLRTLDYNKKIGKGTLLTLKKILIAIAGPIVNLLLILIGINIKHTNISELIVYSNITLFLFNMLPIYPLDGGRVIKGTIHILLGKKKSITASRNISLITVHILTVFASFLILYIKNISVLFTIIVLWIIVLKEEKRYIRREKIYKMLEMI